MLTQLLAPAHSQSSLAGRVRRRPERPRASGCSVERLQALDAELARRAGEAGRLRFEMGRGLHLLERSGGHHALGFSSIEAYALERCERSASWTQKARSLARRLDKLPLLADALISGSLSWSMAAVLATVASPDDADFWLGEASRRTVREMKALVLEKRGGPKTVNRPKPKPSCAPSRSPCPARTPGVSSKRNYWGGTWGSVRTPTSCSAWSPSRPAPCAASCPAPRLSCPTTRP